MQWLLQILKSRAFIISLGLVCLVVLWVMVTFWFAWSTTVLLLGFVVLLLCCVAGLVVHMMRAQRSASAIEQSIRSQAERQVKTSRPDRRAEIEQLQERLETSIRQLKQSKLGRRSGRAALYALPWYLFIGPPGAGKTTAIANSGLNFPMGVDRVRGVGGTRDCDWFFSDSAILLDTAGRYMTEEQDTEEWNAFLETLKKHRPDRPVNGVIVGISISELAEVSREQIEWHADNVRRRVDELIRTLGVRFPVYLVFTKCDLLQGFVEFFGDLSRQERQKVWGATLSTEQEIQNPGDYFEKEYDQLVDALVNLRTMHLGRAMKREDRRRVYVFPMEVGAVKDNLRLFVDRLFQPNPYQETPIFRGFYLTSGTQEGAPIDRVIQSIADEFDLPRGSEELAPSAAETKSYFIKDLFTDVIIPDQYLVQQTSKAATRSRLVRAGTTVGAAVALCLLLLLGSQAVIRSSLDVSRAEEAALAAAEVRWDASSTGEDFERMERLREELELLTRRESRPPLLRLGLYRGSAVAEPARALYRDRMHAFAEAYPVRRLLDEIERASSQRRIEGSEREALYERLRAYLLLSSERQRLDDEANRNFLTRVLTAHSIDALDQRGVNPASPEDVERQVAAYVDALVMEDAPALEADETLVRRTRGLIYEQPSIANAYQRIRQEGLDVLQPFTLADALDGRYLSLFDGEPEIPGFFTREGFERFVADRILEESEDPSSDDWVMGREEGALPETMLDSEAMAAELAQLYFNDYANAWQRFLRQVRYRPFTDVVEAGRAMEQISNSTDSPVLWLLAQATNQTTFAQEGGFDVGDVAGQAVAGRGLLRGTPRAALDRASRARGSDEGGGSEEEAAVHPVEQRFIALHELRATGAVTGDASPSLTQALNALSEVSRVLNDIGGDDARASEVAAQVLSQNGGDLGRELRRIQNSLSRLDGDARRAMFEQPIQQAWTTIVTSAQRHLNRQWEEEVYRTFSRTLGTQYPLDMNSPADTPIHDFEAFFRPENGVIARFVDERLSPFIAGDIRSPRTWEGRGIQISPSVADAVEAADRIGESLFVGGALRLEFELQAELPETAPGAPAVGRITIQAHGRESSYGMGSYRPWEQFVWPGRAGARLTVSTRTGTLAPKEFDGDWAFFRMLQEASVRRQGSAQYEVRWPFEQGITVRYNLRTRSSTNPFNDLRGFFSISVPAALN